ncbi:MAG TPA: hypothetical protein VMV94_08245 [Phycisphaerae bacterium]|nr:hypothetical protein [Phycisphaerae bacterium]
MEGKKWQQSWGVGLNAFLRRPTPQALFLPLPGDINLNNPQTASVPGVSNAFAVGDLDGDGLDDLVVAIPGQTGTAVVLLTRFNNGRYALTSTS